MEYEIDFEIFQTLFYVVYIINVILIMISLREFIEEEQKLGQDLMTEMSNLSKKRTHLPMIIWVEAGIRNLKHNKPRMKFVNSTNDKLTDSELIPISISKDNPEILVNDVKLKISNKDLEILKQWIIKNYDNLISLWNLEKDIADFIDDIQFVND